ncbi:MAG: DUF1816 domain-containing protein [Leptolyngbya sp. SIO3F4]|nr:DUF1816 domain-containing protein [Leptolyngbya sp. SIO3F4]
MKALINQFLSLLKKSRSVGSGYKSIFQILTNSAYGQRVYALNQQWRKCWWLEISTLSPTCDYYFGPFDSEIEAHQEQSGYVEDLEKEGGQVLRTLVVRRKTPAQLTVEYSKAM